MDITLDNGYSFTLLDGVYHITKPGDEKAYVLKSRHSRMPEHIFQHYATDGVDPSPIADDLVAMADDSYEAP